MPRSGKKVTPSKWYKDIKNIIIGVITPLLVAGLGFVIKQNYDLKQQLALERLKHDKILEKIGVLADYLEYLDDNLSALIEQKVFTKDESAKVSLHRANIANGVQELKQLLASCHALDKRYDGLRLNTEVNRKNIKIEQELEDARLDTILQGLQGEVKKFTNDLDTIAKRKTTDSKKGFEKVQELVQRVSETLEAIGIIIKTYKTADGSIEEGLVYAAIREDPRHPQEKFIEVYEFEHAAFKLPVKKVASEYFDLPGRNLTHPSLSGSTSAIQTFHLEEIGWVAVNTEISDSLKELVILMPAEVHSQVDEPGFEANRSWANESNAGKLKKLRSSTLAIPEAVTIPPPLYLPHELKHSLESILTIGKSPREESKYASFSDANAPDSILIDLLMQRMEALDRMAKLLERKKEVLAQRQIYEKRLRELQTKTHFYENQSPEY